MHRQSSKFEIKKHRKRTREKGDAARWCFRFKTRTGTPVFVFADRLRSGRYACRIQDRSLNLLRKTEVKSFARVEELCRRIWAKGLPCS